MRINDKTHYKTILASILCSALIVACAPKKEEEKHTPPQKQEEQKPDTSLSYPENFNGKNPSEQINEDNVMNPMPG